MRPRPSTNTTTTSFTSVFAVIYPRHVPPAHSRRNRYERAWLAAASHSSITHTVFSFYEQRCALSYTAIKLLDATLAFTPTDRPSAPALLFSPWLAAAEPPAGSSVQVHTDAESSSSCTTDCWQARTGTNAHTAIQVADALMPAATPIYRSGALKPMVQPPPLEPKERFHDARACYGFGGLCGGVVSTWDASFSRACRWFRRCVLVVLVSESGSSGSRSDCCTDPPCPGACYKKLGV